eukprot:6405650-Ditylum_brightwellii.AAC.1
MAIVGAVATVLIKPQQYYMQHKKDRHQDTATTSSAMRGSQANNDQPIMCKWTLYPGGCTSQKKSTPRLSNISWATR